MLGVQASLCLTETINETAILTTILASIDPFWKEVMSLPLTITYFQLTLIVSFTLSAILLEVEVTSSLKNGLASLLYFVILLYFAYIICSLVET